MKDSVEPVSIEGTKKILSQLINCICKIKIKGVFGTGFFFINFGKETIKVLMTNYHILNEKYFEESKKLNIYINDEKEIIIIDFEIKRTTYFNKDYDIALIELKEEDKIKNYLELDDNLFQDNPKIIYENKSIYVLQYQNNKNECVSYGLLNSMDKYNFTYKCSTFNESSGSPILNLKNNKLIGMHLNGSINYNKGTLLKLPIKDFINKKLEQK